MRWPKRLTTVLVGVCLCGCLGKKGDPGPTGPPGPSLTGTLVGKVDFYRQCTDPPTTYDGVSVTIEGTAFSTTSNSSGDWHLDQLPTGTYVISFSKPSYGTYKFFGYQFTGGGTAYFHGVSLAEIPTGFTSSITVDSTLVGGYSEPGVLVQYDVAWPCGGTSSSSLIVLGTSGVSLSPATYALARTVNIGGTSHVYESFASRELAYYGIASGTKVYVKTYVALGPGYYDPGLDRTIYTAVSTAAASLDSIAVP